MRFQLRRATRHDIDQIEPMVAAYHDFEQIGSTREQRLGALQTLLADRNLGGLWMVELDDQLAGYIALCRGFSIEFNGFDAFVDEFFLQPEFRGRGLGKRVLAAIQAEARQAGIQALHLEVAQDNSAAQGLYRQAGFVTRDKYRLMSLDLTRD